MKNLLIIAGLLAFAACNDIENCETDDALDFMIVRFYNKVTKQPVKVGFAISASNSPYQFVPFTDSTGVGLPLDPDQNEISFLFDSTTTQYELVMSYEVEASIFDPDCEPSLTYIKLDTVRQTFDSTVVVGTVTNRQLSTNVEIYF